LHDPLVSYEELGHEFSLKKNHFLSTIDSQHRFDAICYAVDHSAFAELTLEDFAKLCNKKPVLFDVKGRFVNTNAHTTFLYKSL
jgi:hypothetical protein